MKEFVRLYFRFIHDRHHSLFHQASVEGEIDSGTLPGVLLYSMMALGARYVHRYELFSDLELRLQQVLR